MIVNLTPHPIRIYHPNVPDRIQIDGEYVPLHVFEPSGTVARISQLEIGTFDHNGVRCELVQYGQAEGLPPYDRESHAKNRRFIVSLVTALACIRRPDLLVPYREVRNLEGTVIGCRALARLA